MKKLFQYLTWLLFLISGIATTSGAQPQAASENPVKKSPLIISVFQQATLLPGADGVFGIIHPGVSAGTAFRYNKSENNQFFQTAKLAVSYHQYVQTSIQIYSEAGYRRGIWQGLGAELRLGAGYLHSIPGVEVFKLKDNGYESRPRVGRPQAMVSAAGGLSYATPQNIRFFVDYQFFIQMPFVKNYVPLVPNTAVHAGVSFPFFKSKK